MIDNRDIYLFQLQFLQRLYMCESSNSIQSLTFIRLYTLYIIYCFLLFNYNNNLTYKIIFTIYCVYYIVRNIIDNSFDK